MLTKDDIIDIFIERLGAGGIGSPAGAVRTDFPAAGAGGIGSPVGTVRTNTRTDGAGGGAGQPPPPPSEPRPSAKAAPSRQEPRGRLFLSEYDIKKKLTLDSLELRIPEDAIISPLAVDWLTLRRIKIVRE